jgi:hypothetical protein
VIRVGEDVESNTPVDIDVLALPEQHDGGGWPEHGSDAGSQDAGPDGMALSGFSGYSVAQGNPQVVDGPDAIDGKIQLTGATEPALFVCLRDDPGDPGAFRNDHGIADPNRVGCGEFDRLAFLSSCGRNILIEPHPDLGPFR